MEKFDQHCIVELMGHIRMAGHVTEPEFGGGSLFRIDIPQTSRQKPYTQLFGKNSIFRMTMCDEKTAKAAAEVFNTPPPFKTWELPDVAQLASGADYDYDEEPDDYPFEGEMPDDLIIEADNSLSESNPVEDALSIPDPAISDAATEEVMSQLIAEDMEGSQAEDGGPFLSEHELTKRTVAEQAREWLADDDVVFLDTETTGLNQDRDDQPVQIAVITASGEVLLDTLVKATIPSASGALRVHHIDEEALKDAPAFAEIRPKLETAIKGKKLVIYDADYDLAILDNASKVDDSSAALPRTWPTRSNCAMHAYAAFYGEEGYYGDWKWQKLTNAAAQCGIEVKDAHTALGDCLMTLEVVKKMAEYNPA